MKTLPLCLAGLFAALLAPGSALAAPEKPNVLVILTDDQGRGDYSACRTPDIRTPNIDRVFREGMTFENFYANSSVCSPTRAALLTGCYPDRVGVPGVIRDEAPRNSWGWLAPQATLLPQQLRKSGYHTAIVGKWHLGTRSPNVPTDRGFDHFHGFLGDMMDDYWTHRRQGHNLMRRDDKEIDPEGHATDLFTDWAVAYLQERAKADRPFFLYLAYNAPHRPIQPPPEWLDKVHKREPGLSEKRTKLVALIEHLDSGIGKVLDALDRTGLAKNTLVIFASDNGGDLPIGAYNGPWRSGKGHMYEGGLRVPGAVRWPGKIKPGTSTSRMALTMDVFPTVCDAVGAKTPEGIDGVSFLPTLVGEREKAAERDLYFVRREGGAGHLGKTTEAIRRGRWKLVVDSPFARPELFDLETDPGETTDLAERRPKVLHELGMALQEHIQRGGKAPWQAPDK